MNDSNTRRTFLPEGIDPYVMGRLLLLQSTVHLVTDVPSMARFVCRGFSEIPGVETTGVFLDGHYFSDNSLLSAGRKSAQRLFETLVDENHGPEYREETLKVFQEKNGVECLKIKTIFDLYGFLFLKVSQAECFAPYRFYVENSLNLIALLIENGKQQALLKKSNETLEKAVEERTIELQESERRYRTLFQSIRDAILVADLNRNIISYNQAFMDLFGYTPAEMAGRKTRYFYADTIQYRRLGEQLQTLQEGAHFFTTIDYRKKSGESFPGETHVFPFVGSDGRMLGFIGLIRDITERRQALEALRKSEQRFRELFNSVSDVVYTHDLSGRFLSVNRAMETFFGCGADEMIGKHAADFLSPQIRPLFENEYLARLKRTGRYEGTTSILKKDGTKVYIEYKSERVSSETGDEYITGIGRDVTGRILAEREKERLEAQLRQAYKIEAVGTLSGGIAHDFNNLLSIIIGNTELIINDPAPAEVNRKCLEEILTAGLRARDVIRRLLTFARKSQENRTPQDLAPIVREALQLLRASIPKNIDLQWEIPGELHAVSADSIQVHQIMINLCSNASDAMSETGGRLTVSLQNTRLTNPKDGVDAPLSPGEYVMLRVEDTGPGILPDNLHRIFDPYFTTKDVGTGTGMGLAIVHGIVTAYNGGICVRSEPGKGTVFEILFPAAEYRTEPDLPATPKPSPGTERILFVDDEKSIADLHRLRLAKLGYRVETRTDSTAALELFRKNPDHFDLVITDMAMPKLTGDKLAEEILKIRPDIPVILCTGYSEHMTEERAKATGIRGFIEKPVDLPVLSNLIREVLSG